MRALIPGPELHATERPRCCPGATQLFGLDFLEFHSELDAGNTMIGAFESGG
jgi:hypothetical protein